MTEPAKDAGARGERSLPRWLLPSLALGLAVGSAVRSMLALPAIAVVVLVAARSAGRTRWLVVLVGGVASLAGLMRFTLEWAVPNIVSSGQHAAEERAVSRLREILWAEDRVRERGWVDTDGDGVGEYAFLGELADQGAPRPGARVQVPLLRPAQFHRLAAGAAGTIGAWRSEGYVYAVYLPGTSGAGIGEGSGAGGAVDAAAAARHWVAYAWPAERNRGGLRAFYIDQDDRICETDNAQGYSGGEKVPAPHAAIAAAAREGEPCGPATGDGGHWRPWKNKRPRASRR